MRKFSFQRALILFELFRKQKVTANDLNAAGQKASHLQNSKDDFLLLVQMCKDTLAGRYKMNTWNMSIIAATILYVVSPVDAIPDLIPVLGWLDDVTIVGYAISKLTTEMKRYRSEMKTTARVVPVK